MGTVTVRTAGFQKKPDYTVTGTPPPPPPAKDPIRWGVCCPDYSVADDSPTYDEADALLNIKSRRLYTDKSEGYDKHAPRAVQMGNQNVMCVVGQVSAAAANGDPSPAPNWAALTAQIAQFPTTLPGKPYGHGFVYNHEFLSDERGRAASLWAPDQLAFKDCLRPTDWWFPNINGYAFSGKDSYQTSFNNKGGLALITPALIAAINARPFSAFTCDPYDGGKWDVTKPRNGAGESPGDRVRNFVAYCKSKGIQNVGFLEWGSPDDINFQDTIDAIKAAHADPAINVIVACEWTHSKTHMWDANKIAMMQTAFGV